jgi:hypothetical protein
MNSFLASFAGLSTTHCLHLPFMSTFMEPPNATADEVPNEVADGASDEVLDGAPESTERSGMDFADGEVPASPKVPTDAVAAETQGCVDGSHMASFAGLSSNVSLDARKVVDAESVFDADAQKVMDAENGSDEQKSNAFGMVLAAGAADFEKGSRFAHLFRRDVLDRLAKLGGDEDRFDGFAFGVVVREEWASQWEKLPKFVQQSSDEASSVSIWFEEHCEALLGKYLVESGRQAALAAARERFLTRLNVLCGDSGVVILDDESTRELLDGVGDYDWE